MKENSSETMIGDDLGFTEATHHRLSQKLFHLCGQAPALAPQARLGPNRPTGDLRRMNSMNGIESFEQSRVWYLVPEAKP